MHDAEVTGESPSTVIDHSFGLAVESSVASGQHLELDMLCGPNQQHVQAGTACLGILEKNSGP